MTPDAGQLRPLLTDLRTIVPSEDCAQVDELIRRLDEVALRVLVVGEAKRGKSTLVNALLGRQVLPTGVVPLTALTTTVRHGPTEQVVVRFTDGTTGVRPLDALADLVTEPGNPGNRRGLAEIIVTLGAELLSAGLELVDTPGAGSVHVHNTAEATQALGRMDAAIFVLTSDPPISATERALLQEVRDRAMTVFCVLNKADRLDEIERSEALDFTRRVVSDELGDDVRVFALSARNALTGGDSGFTEFRAAFGDYLRTTGASDLAGSVATRAARLADSVSETQRVTLAALSMSAGDLSGRLQSFRKALDRVRVQRAEAAAIALATFRRLQTETDHQATQLFSNSRGPLLDSVTDVLARTTGSAGDLEDEVLAQVRARIQALVDAWRAERGGELEREVAALEADLLDRLSRQVAAVRDSAADLFSIDLPDLPAAAHLAAPGRFSYAFAPDPGPTEALTAAVRQRLPGAFGRRRVARYSTERAVMLLDKHIGRARSGFQTQVTETRRQFERGLDQMFAVGAGRIADAVTETAQLRAARHTQITRARSSAQGTLDAATRIAGTLSGLAVAAASPPEGARGRDAALT